MKRRIALCFDQGRIQGRLDCLYAWSLGSEQFDFMFYRVGLSYHFMHFAIEYLIVMLYYEIFPHHFIHSAFLMHSILYVIDTYRALFVNSF